VDFALKSIKWDEKTSVRLQLWDIAGLPRELFFFLPSCSKANSQQTLLTHTLPFSSLFFFS
jgi:hypothetical protein